ncbi:MAG: hypothetical protein ACKVOR_05930 [Flavobacteriales bacterium]
MKHIAWLYALLLLMVAGCTSRAERAAEYNDAIIVYQKQIISALDLLESTFRDSTANEDRVEYAYTTLHSKVKLGILGLDSVGSFQKDPSLQLAARDLFRQYESMVEQEYKTLMEIRLLPQTQVTPAISDTSNAVQTRIYSLTKVSQDKFLRTQREFGKKYHLEFE